MAGGVFAASLLRGRCGGEAQPESQAVLSNLTAPSPCKDSCRLWDQGVGGHSPSGRREGSV